MNAHFVITFTGTDRIGIVDQVTGRFLKCNANIEESRMARLGGEFACIMLVSAPDNQQQCLMDQLAVFEEEGFQILSRKTEHHPVMRYQGWLPFRIRVNGADHEGIINSITHYLASRGINVETISTDSTQAPMSGALLFSMDAVVLVPPDLSAADWKEGLIDAGESVNVDVEIASYKG
jgi:glycine cleavage system transcriptional repressor